MQFSWDDTIVALATPPGVGALGVIRLSGPRAFEIADTVFSKQLSKRDSHTIHFGKIVQGRQQLDEAVASIYRAPRSYTGEDVVEFSCHGSPFILQQVIGACVAAGARIAKPGEFTQRAFLNGKLDLTQAEAVADLIAANSEASQQTALKNMRGGFSHSLKQLREELIRFSALIELELDFSQEDVEFADRTALAQLVAQVKTQVHQLMDSFRLGNVIRNGVAVAIVGKPNAGKSTLLNALLREERAIVSDIPGTTRDTIEELINIDGIIFRLIDTAGIRSHTVDTIEAQGIERSRDKMQKADLVVYVFDVNEMSGDEVVAVEAELKSFGNPYILAGNKDDDEKASEKFRALSHAVFLSARQGRGVEALTQRMTASVLDDRLQTESVVVTNARHFHALKEVAKSLADIEAGMQNHIPGDLLALDIRRCLHFLGTITGEVSNEDLLDYVFSKFCIGK